MASNIQKTIDIIFNGTDQLSSVAGDIEGNIDKATNAAQNMSAPFEAVATSVLAVDAALVAMAATGVILSSNIEAQAVKMKNALGLPTEEAERFSEIAQSVYSAGYGEDLATSFEAVTLAQQKFGDSAETDIEKAVLAASKLQKTFGVEYSESLGAAKTLMTNFGLSSEEAFDFVAAGYQKGLNGSGDFIESINEYATQFANGGSSADQFFSVMESGFQEGMLGTDRAADAFKEFRVRIQDGSKTTADALAQIGLGEEFTNSLASGEMTAIDAFGVVIERLNATKDSSVQLQAGVGLIGTQFEDLGTKAALAIDTTKTDIDDLKGTLSNFDSGTFEQQMTSAWRSALTAVGNLGIWDELKDKIGDTVGAISVNFTEVIKTLDTTGIEEKAEELFNIFASFFEDANIDLTTVEGMQNAAQIVVDSIESMIDVTKGMAEIITPVLSVIMELINDFNSMSKESKELAGNVLALGTALGTASGFLAIGGAFAGGLTNLAGLMSSGGLVSAGLTGIIGLLTGPAGLVVALTAAGAAVYTFASGQQEADFNTSIAAINAQAEAVKSLTDQIKDLPLEASTVEIFAAIETGDLEAAQDLIDEIVTEEYVANIGTETDTESIDRFTQALATLPDEKKTELLALINAGSEQEVEAFLDNLKAQSDITVGVKAKADSVSAEKATETLTYFFKGKEYTIKVPVEATGVEKVKKDIEDVPTEKQVEIILQGEIDTKIAQIKASADTAQEFFKYKAEVDIVEAQEATKQLEAAFNSINETLASSAGVLEAAFGGAESSSYQARNEALDILQQEQDLREKAFELQKQLTEAQIKYTNARTEALEKGDLAITIDTTGLEPALEMIFFEVVKKTQIAANENLADMLLTV